MNERANIGVLAAVLAALCCGGPLLISLALGTAGTAGLLAAAVDGQETQTLSTWTWRSINRQVRSFAWPKHTI